MLARALASRAVVCSTALLLFHTAASADTLQRARVRVDASKPSTVVATHSVDWAAQGGQPRSELAFYLANGVDVTGVQSEKATLTTRSEAVAGTKLKRWIVRLPVPLNAGATRPLVITTRLGADKGGAAKGDGIRVDATSGALLPGSGWFPSLAPNSDELIVHSTDFVLPQGQRGIACGGPSGSAWVATQPGRPYAVWGSYRFTPHTIDGLEVNVWRKTEKGGPPPRAAVLAHLITALDTGLGEATGTGTWKIVDIAVDDIAGGQRTLFWNEAKAAAEPKGITLLDRDIAGGLANAYWAEAMRFEGNYAAFASRSVAAQIGDATAATLDDSDDRWKTQALFAKARRAKFVASRSADRALKNLPLHAASTPDILEGRGTLVAHLAAEALPGATYWIRSAGSFRRENLGRPVTWEKFMEATEKKHPNQHPFLGPFLDGTDVPDFVLGEHGPSTQGSTGQRYKVQVSNRGKIAGPVDISTFTREGQVVRTLRVQLEPGESRNILFGDARRIGQVRLDTRALTPQYAFANEEVTVAASQNADTTPFVPAFTFSLASPVPRRAENLSIQLEGIKITDFKGSVYWYETHHGPTGAVLVGDCTVDIAPGGEFAASFRTATGKDKVTFRGHDIFLRFPLDVWPKIEAQLGEPVAESERKILNARRHNSFEHSYPNGFNEDVRAQVPPPGAALVIFTFEGSEGEWRGYIREPLPDGRVKSRLWDHLHRKTIWEATL